MRWPSSSRSGGVIMGLSGLAALGLAAVAVASTEIRPPSGSSNAPVSETVVAPAIPQPPTDVDGKARLARLAEGNRPVAAQLASLEESLGVPPGALKDRAHIVSTLRLPKLYSDFASLEKSKLAGQRLPSNAIVTVYLETDSGYPLTVSAPADEDHVMLMQGYLHELVNDLSPSGDVSSHLAADGRMLEAGAAEREGLSLQAAAATLTSRLVVLGFEMPEAEYRESGARLRREYDIVAEEVVPGEGSRPFLNLSERLTPAVLSRLHEAHISNTEPR